MLTVTDIYRNTFHDLVNAEIRDGGPRSGEQFRACTLRYVHDPMLLSFLQANVVSVLPA